MKFCTIVTFILLIYYKMTELRSFKLDLSKYIPPK